jgi:20S proteasome subunit beta 3
MEKVRRMSFCGSSDTCVKRSIRRWRRTTTAEKGDIRRRSTVSLYSWVLVLLFFGTPIMVTSQEQNPLTMNGGSVLAMAGKECVALAVDKRFASGPQVCTLLDRLKCDVVLWDFIPSFDFSRMLSLVGPTSYFFVAPTVLRRHQMVNIAPRHIYVPSPELIVAFAGLEGDIQSLSQNLEMQVASKLGRGLGFMKENRQQRPVISPRSMASLTSHVLYNARQSPYYVEPLIVGLTQQGNEEPATTALLPASTAITKTNSQQCYVPFLCSMDCIGAKSTSQAFVCAGAAADSILGTAEALWKPDLEPDELVQICANAFLSALERDCLSGYGAMVYLITRNGITEYDLASRND